MKSAIYKGSHQIQVEERQKPEIGSEDVLLKVHSCGLCGTDIGKVIFDLPKAGTILGHEVAGTVSEIGQNVQKFSVGDRVVVAHHTPCYACHYCKHENVSMCAHFKKSNLDPGGFSEYLRIPAMHVQMTAHKMPERLSFEEAIFMEPLACVVRNIKRAQLHPGDTALIIGLGSVGLMTGQLLKHLNIKVIGSDMKPERTKMALEMGFDACSQANDEEIKGILDVHTHKRGADIVILTAGSPKVYGNAIHFVRGGGKISIFAGQQPGQMVSYDIEQLYKNEVTIYSSYSPAPIDLLESLKLLEDKVVDVSKMSPKTYALNEIAQAIESVQKQNIYKAIIQP